MEVKVIHSLTEVDSSEWNKLASPDYPFLRHEFLLALEQSGSVCESTGWQGRHLLVLACDRLVAALPTYEKQHSWGEYVFDQQWAQAYQHYGLNYYPKWVTTIPFTPCQGPRLLIENNIDISTVMAILLDFIRQQDGVSSWHCLFPEQSLLDRLQANGLLVRSDVQFHWFNRGYRDFDDYLQVLSASKRKMIKRERRRTEEQDIEIHRISGTNISDTQWQAFYRFYTMTYLKRRSQPYLTMAFFRQIAATMPENCLLTMAVKDENYVGAALSFVGRHSLYGRYWGCYEEYNALHFETCYYQGLEYCIANNLTHFDSGAQGEHKIARGFEPILTHSAHWIKDPSFATAIGNFIRREHVQVLRYQSEATNLLPFKKTGLPR